MLDANSINEFPPLVIRQWSDHMRLFADGLEMKAQDVENGLRQRAGRTQYMRRGKRASREFLQAVNDGADPDRAVIDAAQKHRVEPNAISALAPLLSRRMKSLAKIETDRKIMQMHRQGWNDSEIGGALGRHPKTVARRRRAIMKERI